MVLSTQDHGGTGRLNNLHKAPQILRTPSTSSGEARGRDVQKDPGKYSQLYLNTVETQGICVTHCHPCRALP